MTIHTCPICGKGTDKRVEAYVDIVHPNIDLTRHPMHRCSKRFLRQLEKENQQAEEDVADECERTEEQRLCDGFAMLNNEGATTFRPCDCD